MDCLALKVDDFLVDWKYSPNHLPSIIKGALQIGKTEAVEHFSRANYDEKFLWTKGYTDTQI